MFGSTEIIIIVLIVFLLFGAKSLPKFARSLGEARKELKKGLEDTTNEESDSKKSESATESDRSEP
tara:strand:+ start:1611 stop:1808 length:198 start_codon:yes stop_codon:yes gene_type:complete